MQLHPTVQGPTKFAVNAVISEAKRAGSRRQVSQSDSALRMILLDGSGVRAYVRWGGWNSDQGSGGAQVVHCAPSSGIRRGQMWTLPSTCLRTA